ncbi:KN motif and ankyrin repeat domain-containing protein 1-like [Salvelinus fontinalis]|uniref:KN motif and ankyrin repeat domain-containing protein 1-like n=1 Tax=Salvelinus fontinalis TaxID=8038 RepID=UPI002484D8A7|nr:KN motif and ankyrin repeat domain-containing protein 1-like [Salvelinus fontinalis]
MSQDTHIYRNGQGNRGRSVSATEETTPYCLETPYGYQLDLDFLKYVDDIQNGSTINRLRRKPLRATNSRAEAQSGTTPSQSWTSSESLSSASSGDTRVSQSAMSTGNRGRPPLPPPHSASTTTTSNTTPSSQEGSSIPLKRQEGKPAPAGRSLNAPRFNPLVEKTLVETRRRLEQEKTSSTTPAQPHPEPHPRRRLASFGGVGSSDSLSAFTGWGSYNQNNSGNVNKSHAEGELSLPISLHHGSSLGSGGSLRPSPQSSGRDTPVTGLSPLHLQHVRDQMVMAIQRLKELEEQVRSIPVLQVKISVLQEEKRQLVSRMKNQDQEELNDVFRKRAHSTGSAGRLRLGKGSELLGKPEDGLENKAEHNSASSGLKEFQQLTAEMEALERTIKGGRLQARHGLNQNTLRSNCRAHKSVAIGTDEDLDAILDIRSSKQHRDMAVKTKTTETRCIATGVTEAHLVVTADKGSELDAQQRIIEALKERVCQLEAEVKESTLQTEMGRLKLELQAAGARNKADKGSNARPSTHSTSTATEAPEDRPKAQTRSLGEGNHTEVQDASAGGRLEVEGWGCSVGVSCRPELKSVSSGPEVPMTWWVVRERVETRDQCVGRQVVMVTQGVGTGVRVCEAGVNTDLTMESLAAARGWGMECQLVSVGSGDCTVDDVMSAVKEVGMATDPPVRGVDSGVMVSPQTVSQRTNTSPTLSSVSRFTNTCRSFNTTSSTNTVLNTQEKHTNTAHTVTRNIAVGNSRVLELIQTVAKTRSIGIGTTVPWGGNAEQPTQTNAAVARATTRDAGVGMTNLNDNFLVGLKTRNIACGPSCLPDPTKTRSIGIGVGEGRIRDLAGPPSLTQTSHSHQGQSQLEPGLDHYIEKMQCLLREQQGLLTESYSELGEVFIQPASDTTTLIMSPVNSAMTQGGTEDRPIPSQSTDCVQYQSIAGAGQFTNTSPQRNTERSGVSQRVTKESEVKQKILRIEHQTSSALHGQPTNANMLRSIMKKHDGDRGYTGTRKSLKFVGVTTGCESMSTSEPSSSEEEEKNGNGRWREVCGLQDRSGTGGNKGVANRECSGHGRTEIQESFQLSEKMLSACHALKTHLSDDQSLSSRELRSCLNMLQHEWFRVSSQKSAAPAVVEDYLTAFRSVSPAVLGHVANMADGNGNTALHYSVSHSNFTVVKRMLLADVCNVNQQNKAGYTPIMLAALAAVEAPEDMEVVEELFIKGDVNAKASQAGQTALMLAVSHGRMDMVRALLAKGAEVNLQDDEGSTALMCASEHGHAEIVRLLLAKPGCNATLSDSDESTALSIALEAGHKDIAVLLYAHVNFSKCQAGGTPRLGRNTSPSSAGRAVFE